MPYWTGRATISINGANNLVLGGFRPTWARFRVAGRFGGGDIVNHISLGSTDGTHQNVGSTFTDSSGSGSFDDNTKVVSHYERIGGSISEVLNSSFGSFTATGIVLNSTAPNTTYKVTIECGN